MNIGSGTSRRIARLAGAPGQGTANPASLFQNHVVVGIQEPLGAGNKYIDYRIYDPSYGVIHNTAPGGGTFLDAMESSAIAGFYKTATMMDTKNAYKMVIDKEDSSQSELVKESIRIR